MRSPFSRFSRRQLLVGSAVCGVFSLVVVAASTIIMARTLAPRFTVQLQPGKIMIGLKADYSPPAPDLVLPEAQHFTGSVPLLLAIPPTVEPVNKPGPQETGRE